MLSSSSIRKFWFKVFGEFQEGDLIRPMSLMRMEITKEFWVWEKDRLEVLQKIPPHKFVGRVTKIVKMGNHSYLHLVWCGDRRTSNEYVWTKEIAELV